MMLEIDEHQLHIALKQRESSEIAAAIAAMSKEEIEAEIKRRSKNRLQSWAADVDSFLGEFQLDFKKIDNFTVEWLQPQFIVKNEITMFSARPSEGKSLTAFALAMMGLQNHSLERIIYFDQDNGVLSIKSRGIDQVVRAEHNKFFYLHQKSQIEINSILKKLINTNLHDVLIVFDSAKNFLSVGKDRDKNVDVSPLMHMFKALRESGATVLILHHRSKAEESSYAGSSAWLEDVGAAFRLEYNKDREAYIFSPIKDRDGILTECAFTYKNHCLSAIDLMVAKSSNQDIQIADAIIESLSKKPKKYSELKNYLANELGFPVNRVQNVLEAFDGTKWQSARLPEKNARIFSLIPHQSSQYDSSNGTHIKLEDEKTANQLIYLINSIKSGGKGSEELTNLLNLLPQEPPQNVSNYQNSDSMPVDFINIKL